MELALLFVLILINGLFAMSEMSLISSSKARLQKLVDEKRAGAKAALKLHHEPSYFLSTVQVGITSVGILSGALGEDILSEPLKQQLSKLPLLASHADNIALTITVVLITYFSVVMGELVPKRLALLNPERIALIVARPMKILATISSPLVWLLSASSNLLLWLMRAQKSTQTPITNEEIKILMDMGSEAGVFHASESHLVANVLQLDEQRVGAVMTPRKAIYSIDMNHDHHEINTMIAYCPYARVIVCDGGLDNILGILHRSDLLKSLMAAEAFNLVSLLRPPLYVPDSSTLTHLLEFFKENRGDFALIANEYGELEGLVTMSDVLKAIVGEIPHTETDFDPDVVQREDGSWLLDGSLSISRLKSVIGLNGQFPGETENSFNTVGGFILFVMEKIPRVADNFTFENWYFEVVDIDGIRIDKVFVANITNNNMAKPSIFNRHNN
jgi:putative hemolysin